MSNLVSGKEALIALGNGEDVEVRVRFRWGGLGNWISLTDIPDYRLEELLSNKFGDQFRIKPRTITLNGVEVPSPINNLDSFMKDREDIRNFFVYYLDSSNPVNGYSGIRLRDLRPDILNRSMWKNIKVWAVEEEIKQVIDALREVFK